MRVCSEPGCPILVKTGRCPSHRRAADRARGTRQQRGYDADHDHERARWKPIVERGETRCARCNLVIKLGEPWALDHNEDRTAYLGPSHADCNNTAGGVASHRND